jgi:RNA polymerase sigma factor (sigma-70 family)
VGHEAVESIREIGSDSEWAERSVPSLGELFEASWTPMVRLATLLVGSQAIAEDLVSDAFERFAKVGTQPDEPARYLRVVVVNGCHSYHRRRRLELMHRPAPVPGSEDKPLELLDVLGRLSARQRTAIVLRYYVDLPEPEIARILKCRPGTVRTVIQRALLKLKKELSE